MISLGSDDETVVKCDDIIADDMCVDGFFHEIVSSLREKATLLIFVSYHSVPQHMVKINEIAE